MLTPKQEVFVQKIIEGMSQADAYRAAYSTKNMTDKSIWETASKLAADPKVRSRLEELREQVTAKSIMTAQERLSWLTEVIQSPETSINDKLRAADIMNKMQGEYIQKIAAEVQTETTINIELVDDE